MTKRSHIQIMECNQKFIEILHNIITEQNKELLKIISKEHDIDIDDLIQTFIMSKTEFKSKLSEFIESQ